MERGEYDNRNSLDSLKIKQFDSEQEIYQTNEQFAAGNYNHEQNMNQNQIDPNNMVANSITPNEEQSYSQQIMTERQSQMNAFVKEGTQGNPYGENDANDNKIYFEYEENLSRNPFISSSQNSLNNSYNNFNNRNEYAVDENNNPVQAGATSGYGGYRNPAEDVLEEDDENVSFGEQSPHRNRGRQSQNFKNYSGNNPPAIPHLPNQKYKNESQFPFQIPEQSSEFFGDIDQRRGSGGGNTSLSEGQLYARDSIRNVDSVTERIPVSKDQLEYQNNINNNNNTNDHNEKGDNKTDNNNNHNNNKQFPFFQKNQEYDEDLGGYNDSDNQFQKLIRMQTCPADGKQNFNHHRLSNELYVSEYKNQHGYYRKNSDGTETFTQVAPPTDQKSNNQQEDNKGNKKADKKMNVLQGQKQNGKQTAKDNQKDQTISKEMMKYALLDNNNGTESSLQCQISEHDGEKVIMVCTDPYCDAKFRLCCGYCNQLHAKHIKSLIRLQEYRYSILSSSKILDQPTETDNNNNNKNNNGKGGDDNRIYHKELLYLCMQKQNQMYSGLKKHLDTTFLQMQKLVEDKEKQILSYISSFDEEYNYYCEKLQLLKSKEYQQMSNKDFLKMHNFQKQPQKFLEHQKINEGFRKKQLAELDDFVYDYYINLQDIFDTAIEQSSGLLYDLLQKLTSNQYKLNQHNGGNTIANNSFNNNNNNNNLVDHRSNNSFSTPKKSNQSLQTTFSQGINDSDIKNSSSQSPLKKFVARAANSLIKMSNHHDMSDRGVPGYKRITELPTWCTQMLHVQRAQKKLGVFKFENIKPNTINLGIQQNMKSESIYIGDWINYMKEGNGVEYSKKDSSFYEGEWAANHKHGNGRMISKNDVVYLGQFEDNKKCGYGILYQFGGKRYEGQWNNDQPNGRGTQYFPNGDIFQGEFKNGIKQGEGTFKYFDGTVLSGTWERDQANGQCRYIKLDGSSYEGEYLNGKKQGFGTYTWNDGRKYTGQWHNGVQNGQGYYTNHLGISVQGIWKNGKKIQQEDSEFSKSIIR